MSNLCVRAQLIIVKQKPCFAFKLLKYVGPMLALLATKVAYIYNLGVLIVIKSFLFHLFSLLFRTFRLLLHKA